MAGPVLTSFKLPSTSVLHTAKKKKKKKDCFSKNVYLLIVEVCSYPAQPFKHEEFETQWDGWMDGWMRAALTPVSVVSQLSQQWIGGHWYMGPLFKRLQCHRRHLNCKLSMLSKGCSWRLKGHWSERLDDGQRSGVWSPEKFSQIGSNVPFKHRQTQVFVFPPSFSYWPTLHRRFGSVFGKGMFFFYSHLPPHIVFS